MAVNLSRPVRLSAHADRDVVAQSHALQPGARCGRAASVAPAWRPMPPGAAAICLLEICDAESLPVRGDVLRVCSTPAISYRSQSRANTKHDAALAGSRVTNSVKRYAKECVGLAWEAGHGLIHMSWVELRVAV